MKKEKTPEEKARSKRINANVMIAAGAVMAICGLAGALIILSGRADAPDWIFGGASMSHAVRGSWSDPPNRLVFSEWGREPFLRAEHEGKLVLLYLGPSYGATTARLESALFADPEIAQFVIDIFVPIRVKSEIYPDLDRRYRAGGWPTVAILMPNGMPLDAGIPASSATFRAWVQTLSDRVAKKEQRARIEAASSSALRSQTDSRFEIRPPPRPESVELAARTALSASWDPQRRTFDQHGPRYPRFERIRALQQLPFPWARELSPEATKGLLIFQDPKDGGFWRSANPDGTPAALEKRSVEQAGAMDALCGAHPQEAQRLLGFLDREFRSNQFGGWKGWLSGWAFDPENYRATDGDEFDSFVLSGMREFGRARIGETAELSRAVLSCGAASLRQKRYAKTALQTAFTAFNVAAHRGDPRLLLDDAVALGTAALATGKIKEAIKIFRWMEANLAVGPAYLDRIATGVLPPVFDRIPDPTLNARAWSFVHHLTETLPLGSDRRLALERKHSLLGWLSAQAGTLDPAVWTLLTGEASATGG